MLHGHWGQAHRLGPAMVSAKARLQHPYKAGLNLLGVKLVMLIQISECRVL